MVFDAPTLDTTNDATASLTARLEDPSLWSIRTGVPVFVERAETNPETGAQLVFGEPELQAYLDGCNAMNERGDYINLTLGHTIKDAPEHAQPPTVGFGQNFRLGHFGPEQKLGILYDEWVDPRWIEVAETYPFRSVERWENPNWPVPKYFRPVAFLRREPELKMGVVSYQAGARVTRYSAETYMSAPPAPPAAAPAAPAAPAPEVDPVAADKQKFHQYAMEHPCLGAMVKKYAAENNLDPETGNPIEAAAPEQAAAEGPGTPAATNVATPKLPGKKEEEDVEKLKAKYGANSEPVRYAVMQRELADLKAWKEQQETEVAKAQADARVQRYSADLHQLKAQGYTFDHDEVLAVCKVLTPEQFEAQKDVLVKYGTKVPIRYGAAPVERNVPTGGKPAGITPEQQKAALKAAAKNPAKYGHGEDAFTKALADVKAGTV